MLLLTEVIHEYIIKVKSYTYIATLLRAEHQWSSLRSAYSVHIRLFGNPILVENAWYLRHPLLSIDAVELSLRWQICWPIHRTRHDVPEVVFGTFSIFKDASATCWTEFTMQERAGSVISFVDGGLRRGRLNIRK